VVVPLNNSADDSVSLPVDEPPATSTLPLATIEVGSTVAEWPTRGVVIVPADDHVPLLTEGSNVMAVARTVDPFLPPVIMIFPLEFGMTEAVCCSLGLLSDASVLNAFWTGS
jgi:hypothetical protein